MSIEGVGARLRQTRKARGWTQKELGEEAGSDQANIQKIENNKVRQPRNIQELADALGVSAAWLQFGAVPKALLSKEVYELALMIELFKPPYRQEMCKRLRSQLPVPPEVGAQLVSSMECDSDVPGLSWVGLDKAS